MDLEMLEQLDVKPGDLGENITTKGMGLLGVGTGTRLHFIPAQPRRAGLQASSGHTGSLAGAGASEEDSSDATTQRPLTEVEHPILVVTGLRNPCAQISHFRQGLQENFLDRDEQRKIIARRAGVMSIVEVGGQVGMRIVIEEPPLWKPLECA